MDSITNSLFQLFPVHAVRLLGQCEDFCQQISNRVRKKRRLLRRKNTQTLYSEQPMIAEEVIEKMKKEKLYQLDKSITYISIFYYFENVCQIALKYVAYLGL